MDEITVIIKGFGTFRITDPYDAHLIGIAAKHGEKVGEGSGTHHENTGACICTSFRWDRVTNNCPDCKHPYHGSRVHCGGLK